MRVVFDLLSSLRMNSKTINVLLLVGAAALVGYFYVDSRQERGKDSHPIAHQALAAKFETLSEGGNSSCSASFNESIDGLADSDRIQGSCCSPMSLHRYKEQVEGLEKFSHISEIPPDPYDLDAKLAKKLKAYYNVELTPEQQAHYDYAMEHSSEKGPCCCKCWRWYVYGGLGKLLIQQYGFTGEQLTEVWNLSDGCGGDEEHHH